VLYYPTRRGASVIYVPVTFSKYSTFALGLKWNETGGWNA
jgi:hypothetical protein